MMSAATYAGWDLSTIGSHDKIWRSYDGLAAPLLVNWLTPITVTVTVTSGTASYVYDGTVHSVSASNVTYSTTPNPDLLLGTFSLSGKNVGVYTGGGNYSVQQGYDIISAASGSLTITPAPLTATVAAQSRAYDGTTAASLAAGQVTLTGFIGSDSATSKAVTGNYNSKDVATANTVSFALTGSDLNAGLGTLLSNYSLPATTTAAGTITRLGISASLAPVSKTYDGTTSIAIDPSAFTLSGFINGEGATVSSANGIFNSKNVKEATTVTASLSNVTGTGSTNLGNYTLPTSITAAGTITPKPVIASIVNADRVYDGTDKASSLLDVVGLVQGEQLVLTGTGHFSDKNAGVGKTVSITSISSNSVAASNYAIAGDVVTGTATITPKNVTVAASAKDKVYDGGVAAIIGLAADGVVAGDQLSFSGSGVFGDKNVADGKTVTVTGIAGVGADSANYRIANTSATTQASITPLALKVAATSTDKVYDGNTSAQVQLNSSNVVAGDQISLAGTGSFADKNAAIGKIVTVNGIVIGGKDGGNYTIASPVTTTATIAQRGVSVTASASDKVYDGKVDASVALNVDGVLQGDQLTLSGNAVFADKNVGAAKSVTVTSISGAGADAGNYRVINDNVNATASITPRPLTLQAIGTNKVYDGGVADAVSVNAIGVVAGDAFVITGDGRFADKNAGQNKPVSVTGLRASGADATNYSFTDTTLNTTATITPKPVALTATATDKVYDGTVADQVNLSAAGVLAGDQVSFSGAGAFADRNVGTGKVVTVSGITASGADAANYSYNSSAASQASITPRQLTVTLAGPISKVVDGNTDADLVASNYNVGNVVAGESVTVNHAAGLYQDALVGRGKVVSTTLAAGDYAAGPNTALGNYLIVTGGVSGTVGTIRAVNAASSANATVNGAGITGEAGDVSLPLAFNAVLASMPTPATGGDQQAAGANGSAPIGTVRTSVAGTGADSLLAPAQASAVSANTRENLLFRRAFSIGDGGIRLPQGVRGSEKDAQ